MSQMYGHGFLPVTIYEDSNGYEVRGPAGARVGDLVVAGAKGPDPLILMETNGAYELVGTCYLLACKCSKPIFLRQAKPYLALVHYVKRVSSLYGIINI